MDTKPLHNVRQVLETMDTITLEEMSHVQLMRRHDTKYVVPLEELSVILQTVSHDYKVLGIKGQFLHDYETLYFDTSDYKMYYAHHDQHLNRYKIRMREYRLSGDRFLEIKFKNQYDETIKTRIPIKDFSYDEDAIKSKFLKENSPFSLEDVRPMLKNKFVRMTLVSKHRAERLTIDIDLCFTNEETSYMRDIGQLAIIEVKRDAESGPSDIVDALHSRSYRAEGFSKYCIGTAMINFNVKFHQLKQRIKSLGLM